jgi:arylsulfatase A-like enzyme/Flp pilus assembly protein TadD
VSTLEASGSRDDRILKMTCSIGRCTPENRDRQGRPFVSFVSLVSLVPLVSLMACTPTPSTPANAHLQSGSLAKSNLLLVTVDTLRADRVSSRLTPAIDRLAAAGVRFTNAHAHAPMTLPAHTSILTGLVPPGHGIRNNGSTALPAGTPTLASVLHDAGYRTGAFVGAFVLDARFGLGRGFDVYDDRVGSDTGPVTFAFAERTADRVTALAADWILSPAAPDARDQRPPTTDQRPRSPWFCWIHLFDPHAPYRAPEQRVADPYDNEVAFTDAELGRLFDRLRAAGQFDSTLIVVVADHGESLGEHGEATHGLFAYEPTLHIPLIVAGPSIRASVSGASAGQADLVPTVLDLLGVTPPAHVDGESLLPAMRGEAFADRPIYFEALDAYLTRNWAPLTGVVLDGWKYVDVPDAELYDLRTDPGELRNRIGDEAPRAAALGRRLSEWTARSSAPAVPAPIDADAAARLRALGYTASQAREARRTRYTTADDPKRLLDLDRRYERALTLTGDRHYGEAAAFLQSVIADRPDFTVAYLNLASIFIAEGDPKRAIALLEAAAARDVTSPELRGRLGAAYLASGDPNRAAATLEPVAKPDVPGGLEAMNSLAIALTQRGGHERARRLLSEVLERSPRSATTWSNLGLLELSAHRSVEAGRAFEQAVAADPRLGQAWEGLGAARARSDPWGAIDAWKHAVDVEPRNYDVLFNLAVMLRDHGRAAEARAYVERFVREAPPDRYSRDIATMRSWLGQ